EPADIAAIAGAYHSAPFDVLGQHAMTTADGDVVSPSAGIAIRTFQPQATAVSVCRGEVLTPMQADEAVPGFYEAIFPGETNFSNYQLEISLPDGTTQTVEDPYRFGPVLSEYDLYLFGEGNHYEIYEKLGAHLLTHEGAAGVVFAVWAPSAQRVSVV